MAIYATGCLCCLSLAGTSCATGEEPVYDNPLRTSAGDTVRLADPFVYESDGLYYMTGTTASAEASGFDYYVSSDLVAWEYGGPLFRKSPAHKIHYVIEFILGKQFVGKHAVADVTFYKKATFIVNVIGNGAQIACVGQGIQYHHFNIIMFCQDIFNIVGADKTGGTGYEISLHEN